MAGTSLVLIAGCYLVILVLCVDGREKATPPRDLKDIVKFIELVKIKNRIESNIRQFTENRTVPEPVPTKHIPIPRPILIISERADSKDCMTFSLVKSNLTDGEVPAKADLWVYVKSKKTGNKSVKNKMTNKKKGRRLKLIVTGEGQKLSTLRVRVSKSKWYKIELPISVVHKVFKTHNKILHLCLICKQCNKKYHVVLLSHHKSGSRTSKSLPNIRKEQWPFLVLHSKPQFVSYQKK
ncbi:hypothetical protein CHS0354_026246 [Potamilus streckersoni]|uniref:Uncharacterized protein n=1 Tax=Potamilus streckersoni TaxID=2493646 RepID=A0AAE0TFE9_9BIVA|nr:hypothetical protein CHS0354_026246 [Potamilus streckersoni]